MSRWFHPRGTRRQTTAPSFAANSSAEAGRGAAFVAPGRGTSAPTREPAGPAAEANPAPIHSSARVVVLSRQGCHLCEEAEQVAEQVSPGDWVRVDVDQDESLRQRYNDHVPVVWVDGRLLTYWTLDAGQLRDALTSRDWPAPPQL